jgi:hypothetical protein
VDQAVVKGAKRDQLVKIGGAAVGHTYNHHRNHTAIGGPPINRVTNLPAQHT